jgi:hypothetical protein
MGTTLKKIYFFLLGTLHFRAISFTIHLGSNHLEQNDPNKIIVATSDYELHPDFNPDTLENDVGLIKLRQPVMYNGNTSANIGRYDT